jgi:hypothetical protein
MANQFIEIVENNDIVGWQYVNPDTKQQYDSQFNLRVADKDVQKKWKKKYTRVEMSRSGRQEIVDWAGYNEDALDFCIVGWTGVRRKGVDLPCEREWKLLLPEMVKAEIIRLCIGKELGQAQADEQQSESGGDGEGPRVSDPLPSSAPISHG